MIRSSRTRWKIPDGEYFEYLLTRFTEPSEVFGPIDIAELRSGRYLRRSNGKLPTARLVFLDEIFKANSAILNSLLTVINERKFYQDGQPVPVKLRILLAATNELPENVELAALKDRFCLKAACRSVQDEHFVELIDAGLDAYTHRELNQKPWIEGHASLEDFVKAHRYLTHVLARRTNGPDGNQLRDRDLYFSDELLRELRRVLKTLVREDGVFVSDRKVVKLYRLLRTNAWITHGGAVERSDLRLLGVPSARPATRSTCSKRKCHGCSACRDGGNEITGPLKLRTQAGRRELARRGPRAAPRPVADGRGRAPDRPGDRRVRERAREACRRPG